MSTKSNVTAGKAKTAGPIFVAATDATLPTSAAETLDAAFTALGYMSEDGLTNSNSPESSDIKAWGGDIVLSVQTGKPDTFKFKMIEALNVDVLKAVYGSSNVTGTLAAGITVNANSTELPEQAWVADMIMRNGAAKRVVIPSGKITEISEIAYTDSDAVGYEVTVTAYPDESGNTHYEYIKAA